MISVVVHIKNMIQLPSLFIALVLGLGCGTMAGCATVYVSDKVSSMVWASWGDGQSRDLVVEFDHAGNKQTALALLPAQAVEVLKDYDALPLMLLRFRSAASLKALLTNPSVVNAYEDRQENKLPQRKEKP